MLPLTCVQVIVYECLLAAAVQLQHLSSSSLQLLICPHGVHCCIKLREGPSVAGVGGVEGPYEYNLLVCGYDVTVGKALCNSSSLICRVPAQGNHSCSWHCSRQEQQLQQKAAFCWQ
jgi:hypothetical protein